MDEYTAGRRCVHDQCKSGRTAINHTVAQGDCGAILIDVALRYCVSLQIVFNKRCDVERNLTRTLFIIAEMTSGVFFDREI